jgi:hypothetical protein
MKEGEAGIEKCGTISSSPNIAGEEREATHDEGEKAIESSI